VRLRSDGEAVPAFEQQYSGTAVSGARIVTPIVLRLELLDTPPGDYALEVGVTDVATGVQALDSRTTLEVSGLD
jgi:hypothetical protein